MAQLVCGTLLLVCSIFILLPYFPSVRSLELIDLSFDGRINESRSSVISIDVAHSRGLSHRGIWLFIVDENNELLLLKRNTGSVTCPGTWSAPGEHTRYLEPYMDTAYRGLQEELGLNKLQVISVTPLSESPWWLHIRYDNMGRKTDAQWTASFLVRVLRRNIEGFNAESTMSMWVPVKDFDQWSSDNPHMFCKVTSFQYKQQSSADALETNFRSMLNMNIELVKSLLHTNTSQQRVP